MSTSVNNSDKHKIGKKNILCILNNIESTEAEIKVLKSEEVIKKYGKKGENGVIIVITK